MIHWMVSDDHKRVTGAPGPSQSSLSALAMFWTTLWFIGMVRHSRASV